MKDIKETVIKMLKNQSGGAIYYQKILVIKRKHELTIKYNSVSKFSKKTGKAFCRTHGGNEGKK